MALWEVNIPQEPDGICSCVRHVRFDSALMTSLEPTTFGRILKPFESMLALTMRNIEIPPPEELTDPISLGEFGKGVTHLVLSGALYTPLTILTSFIFSPTGIRALTRLDGIPLNSCLPAVSARPT